VPHVLVNNAGVMTIPELQRTAQGREMQFATNYLGHFALALGLRPHLAKAKGARIVSVASTGSARQPHLPAKSARQVPFRRPASK
jgi:NAD(P)-dependent dehydrogenase (short-subunit alcohol dehydrogenase family)